MSSPCTSSVFERAGEPRIFSYFSSFKILSPSLLKFCIKSLSFSFSYEFFQGPALPASSNPHIFPNPICLLWIPLFSFSLCHFHFSNSQCPSLSLLLCFNGRMGFEIHWSLISTPRLHIVPFLPSHLPFRLSKSTKYFKLSNSMV